MVTALYPNYTNSRDFSNLINKQNSIFSILLSRITTINSDNIMEKIM